ncbi:MAG: extracellular solute-binding protein [Anaerolineae bacterium]|nr:extracellular solute-binding protein [Anaerolineae bacterium]
MAANRKQHIWMNGILLLIMLLSLVGCGRHRAEPTPEPITLRFAFRRHVANYEALASQFQQEHPDITVDLVPVDPFRGGLRTIEGQEIDVVRWDQSYLTPERLDNLLSLDEILLADETFPYQDMFQDALRVLQYEGVQWGIPAGLDFTVAYYNAQRFESVGASPPTPNWTPDDLLAAAVAVNNTEGSATGLGFTYGFCSEPDSADPVLFTYIFGGRLFDRLPDPSRPTLDDPANVTAIQWYADLYRTYGVMPAPGELRKHFPRGRKYEAIIRGKCGIWFGQYSDRNGQTWGIEWQNKAVMLPLPHGKGEINPVMVDGYYILSQSQHRQEAWQWIRFLLDHQEAAGQMEPPLRSQVNSREYKTRVGEDVAAIARGLTKHMFYMPVNPPPPLEQVVNLYLTAVQKVVQGDVDAETALADAQAQAETLFKANE